MSRYFAELNSDRLFTDFTTGEQFAFARLKMQDGEGNYLTVPNAKIPAHLLPAKLTKKASIAFDADGFDKEVLGSALYLVPANAKNLAYSAPKYEAPAYDEDALNSLIGSTVEEIAEDPFASSGKKK